MTNALSCARFGWQGIEIDVPDLWELGAFGGDYRAGHAALDDGLNVRLQVRWNRRGRSADPDDTVRVYERSLRKKQGAHISFTKLTPEFLPARCRHDRDIALFQWTDDQAAYGLAWRCHVCACAGLVEVLSPSGEASAESPRKTARRVLSSISDHRDDGLRRWAVYDFVFLLPAAYNLERPDLTPGRLEFSFRDTAKGRMYVGRWSLAAECLKRTPLADWTAVLAKRVGCAKSGAFEQAATSVQGQEGWRFAQCSGRRRMTRRVRVEGLVWWCPDNDKIYAVVAQGGGEGLLDTVAATIGGT